MTRTILLAALLFPVTAGAQAVPTAAQVERAYSRTYDTCMKTGDAARGVTPAMVECIHAEDQRQDVVLNARYKAVMARLNAPARRKLQTSERAWIKSRETECRRVFEATGGSIDRINGASCFLDSTIRRRLWLERYR